MSTVPAPGSGRQQRGHGGHVRTLSASTRGARAALTTPRRTCSQSLGALLSFSVILGQRLWAEGGRGSVWKSRDSPVLLRKYPSFWCGKIQKKLNHASFLLFPSLPTYVLFSPGHYPKGPTTHLPDSEILSRKTRRSTGPSS